jgi:hypothetical protein
MTILGRSVGSMMPRAGAAASRAVPTMRRVGSSFGATATAVARRGGLAATSARNYIGPMSKRQKIATGAFGTVVAGGLGKQTYDEISDRRRQS